MLCSHVCTSFIFNVNMCQLYIQHPHPTIHRMLNMQAADKVWPSSLPLLVQALPPVPNMPPCRACNCHDHELKLAAEASSCRVILGKLCIQFLQMRKPFNFFIASTGQSQLATDRIREYYMSCVVFAFMLRLMSWANQIGTGTGSPEGQVRLPSNLAVPFMAPEVQVGLSSACSAMATACHHWQLATVVCSHGLSAPLSCVLPHKFKEC